MRHVFHGTHDEKRSACSACAAATFRRSARGNICVAQPIIEFRPRPRIKYSQLVIQGVKQLPVIVDGRRINSCLSLAVMHEGAKVTTIEGLGNKDKLHPMQAAFVKHDGYQCGYCTPGQICSAVSVLSEIKQGIPSHVSAEPYSPRFSISRPSARCA